jgi:MFS family permease
VFLKESKQPSDVNNIADGPGVALQGASEPPAQPLDAGRIPCQAIFLYLAGFLMFFGFASFESVTGFYLSDTYFIGEPTESAQFYGFLFITAGITMLLVAVLIYKPVLKCFGEKGTVALGAMLRMTGFFMLSWAPNKWFFLGFSQLMVGGGNLLQPTTSSMLTSIVPPTKFGKALGISQSFQGVARIVGPVAFGSIYDRVGHTIPFYINGIMSPLAMLLIFLVRVPDASDTEQLSDDRVAANEAALEENGTNTVGDFVAQVSSPTAGLARQLSNFSAGSFTPAITRQRSTSSAASPGGLSPSARSVACANPARTAGQSVAAEQPPKENV